MSEWQPIETAPKDGTVVDLWSEEFGRQPGCYFGLPSHECGEYGRYCDSDWHNLTPGWVSDMNEPIWWDDTTHWMPLPEPPKVAP